MMDKTREKYLRQGLIKLYKHAEQRRQEVAQDNKTFHLTAQERMTVRALDIEMRSILKFMFQAYNLAGIEIPYADEINSLPGDLEYLPLGVTNEELVKLNIEAFVVRKALLRSSRQRAKVENQPRGNPVKGGLVKKLIAQGYNLLAANQEADRLLAIGEKTTFELHHQPKVESEPDPQKIKEALEMLDKAHRVNSQGTGDMSITQLNRAMMGSMTDADFDSSANLNPLPKPEPVIKTKTKSQDEIIAAIKKAQKSPQLFKSTVFSRMSAQIARDAKKE